MYGSVRFLGIARVSFLSRICRTNREFDAIVGGWHHIGPRRQVATQGKPNPRARIFDDCAPVASDPRSLSIKFSHDAPVMARQGAQEWPTRKRAGRNVWTRS